MHTSGSAKTEDRGLNQGLRTAWRRSARPRLCLLRPLAAGRGWTFARHERRAGHAKEAQINQHLREPQDLGWWGI